jgi:hypothetical protein
MKKSSSSQPNKRKDWSTQDQAFFGDSSESTRRSGGGSEPNHFKTFPTRTERTTTTTTTATTSTPRTLSQEVRKQKSVTITNINLKRQKQKIASFANKASSKLSQIVQSQNHPKSSTTTTSRNDPKIRQLNQNDKSNDGGWNTYQGQREKNGVNTSTSKQKSSAKNNSHIRTTTEQPPSSISFNGKSIVRSIKNAVVSQVPIPCIYCNALPLMYKCHPFWGSTQRICSNHDYKTIPKCLSCHKFQPKNKRFHEVGTSGSLLCPSCAQTAILDDAAAGIVFNQVLSFFQSYGLDMFNDRMFSIPLKLCSPQEMKDKFNSFKSDNSADQYGVCCWMEVHSPLGAAAGIIGAGVKKLRDKMQQGNNYSTKATQRNPFGGGRYVYISQIAALKGLPRLYLGNILAHEATHAWLALNPMRKQGVAGENVRLGVVRKLPLLVEEGLCQLMAHLYLDSVACNNNLSPSESSLVEYNLWSIENHSIHEYGEGYKQAERAYKHILDQGGNLHDLLQYVSMHKSFPTN